MSRYCFTLYVALLTALLAVAPDLAGFRNLPGLQAQSGGQYDLTWNTVDGGGVTALTVGAYTLSGTAGQPDAAVWRGGDYVITGGFWRAPSTAGGGYSIYLPLVLRNY